MMISGCVGFGRDDRGSIMPMTAVAIAVICGFTGLAIDLGMMAIAKNQCQNAADAAALTAARTLTGGSNPNTSGAVANGTSAVTQAQIIGGSFQSGDVSITNGSFYYNMNDQTFHWTTTNPTTYNLSQATVTHAPNTAFSKIFGYQTFNLAANATAAHRPRDVSIVLDYSGSMNNESDFWNCETYLGNMINTPNSGDATVPQFGHYSDTTAANLIQTSTDPRVGMCNITQSVLGVPPLVNDYYQMNRGQPTVYAFSPQPSASNITQYMTTPLGDNYYVKSSGGYAQTVQDITNDSGVNFGNPILNKKGQPTGSYYGYQAANQAINNASSGYAFNGYTIGPGYWGATFFMWPPDPNNDWRSLYFLNSDGSAITQPDNTMFWNSSGQWNSPTQGNYQVNYKAILSWIKTINSAATAQNGNPIFPKQLRAGLITYYTAIPGDVPSSAYTYSNANSQISNADQRFWKEYIDFALGIWKSPFGSTITPGSPACSYGPDYQWGTVQISAPPTNGSYMNPTDNPLRPRNRFWFGPITMIQYIADTGLNPGTVHDISMYPAKLGISGALQDIQINHPNDMVSMILFSRPQYNNDPPNIGMFNYAQANLGTDYQSMINGLWYPPNSGPGNNNGSDVRPWDSNGVQTPRAYGDFCANTATQYGFLLAYNQFSSSSVVRSQNVGGLGRIGSQRMIMFETDGMANQDSIPPLWFTNNGPNQSYYNILPGQTLNGAGFSMNDLVNSVIPICNNADGTPGNPPTPSGYTDLGHPGYSTPSKPVTIQTVAFGVVFEPTANTSIQQYSVQIVQTIAQVGGTIFPSSSTDPTNGFKWCIGTLAQRQAKLQQAFSTFMDDGITVTLMNPNAYANP